MKLSIIIAIVVSVLAASCSHENREIKKYISNEDFKYWYRYHRDTSKPYAIGYCFKKDGTYIEYCNPNYNRKIRALCNDPNLSKPIWKIINDSSIMFGEGILYKIIALNQDSMILQNLKFPNDSYIRLHRDKDQITKPKTLVYWDTAAPPGM